MGQPLAVQGPQDPATVAPEALPLERLPIRLIGDDARVIARPFVLGPERVRDLFHRIEAIDEDQLEPLLATVVDGYEERHRNVLGIFRDHFEQACTLAGTKCSNFSEHRKLLAGAYVTMEYAIDSAALFNPSIVPHPDQSNLKDGELRFLMSLRATGEGHVSSIVFRTGIIRPGKRFDIDPLPKLFHPLGIAPDRHYEKKLFRRKLSEMRITSRTVDDVLNALPEKFTPGQLNERIEVVRADADQRHGVHEIAGMISWLAQSNYHIDVPADARLDEVVIFPMTADDAHGLEDLRMVRFTDDDGTTCYYGTYTAYNGISTLPMLISTRDFRRIEVHSLNGKAARNKGMAIFPRKIGGHYCVCTRIDGQNLFISFSDSIHFLETAEQLITPKFAWELMQIGNCGSPVETSEGWLLLTHGVGPMRSYAIGAMLLDKNDPLKVIGHLKQPLIVPRGAEREGYVPNVVYTCGYLEHNGQLYVPYAQSDKSTSVISVPMEALMNRLLEG